MLKLSFTESRFVKEICIIISLIYYKPISIIFLYCIIIVITVFHYLDGWIEYQDIMIILILYETFTFFEIYVICILRRN